MVQGVLASVWRQRSDCLVVVYPASGSPSASAAVAQKKKKKKGVKTVYKFLFLTSAQRNILHLNQHPFISSVFTPHFKQLHLFITTSSAFNSQDLVSVNAFLIFCLQALNSRAISSLAPAATSGSPTRQRRRHQQK